MRFEVRVPSTQASQPVFLFFCIFLNVFGAFCQFEMVKDDKMLKKDNFDQQMVVKHQFTGQNTQKISL